MSAKLQKPDYVFMGGSVIPWDEALLHVGCEAVTRGLSVFEGLKGYWDIHGNFGIVFLEKHYKRLLRSARLLQIPCPWTYEQFEDAVFKLIGKLLTKEKDMWARTTLYVIEGHWGENTNADLVITAYNQEKKIPEPINLGVSTWQRATDSALPARIKTGSNYQMGRLARIEGRSRNFSDMILLNNHGRIAEATASCVLLVRDGVIYTPPAYEGSLESITLDFVEVLAGRLGIPFVRRPIDHTELFIADEIALCGSLAELVQVKSIDGRDLSQDDPVLGSVREKFFKIVRGEDTDPAFDVSYIPKSYLAG